ncbi:MAG: type II toxin-antitoxin system RelE/ParE family toxin [Campylobacterales bacterium]|nr:type II toxin-antitoxin system RelE/ParE family toxin [Campylobacterales bacterium]
MRIIKDRVFQKQFYVILKKIAYDKPMASLKFEKELSQRIKNLVDFPYQYRPSNYFEDKAYRDLIYSGYTIIYKVEKEQILILEIFKWQER